MDPLRRAEAFAKSQRVIDLIRDANEHGVTVELKGKTITIKRSNSESANSMEWRWDTPDAEDYGFSVLQRKVEIYKPKN